MLESFEAREQSYDVLDNWLDVAGLMPPLSNEVSEKVFGKQVSGLHTFTPTLVTREAFENDIAPKLKTELEPALFEFIKKRVERTFEIRHTLKRLQSEIIEIVGEGNFSALWLDREAFSSDSMEHRALVTEAVIHVYSAEALQKVVTLLYAHKVPMIPYGEGGGYNMGVTPMAPAVTISVRGIDHISDVRVSRRDPTKFEISVGAGVPFKDLQAYLARRNYVLRCDPNTPRAATGGIAATGSNGGRKAFEVVLHGRAVTAQGIATCFALDEAENRSIETEPFLLARKFFSVSDPREFQKTFEAIRKQKLKACVTPNLGGVRIPLQGMKAAANMLSQKAEASQHGDLDAKDTMAGAPTLPISAFIGAEGSTGFIYEVTFEIERPLEYLKGARWHFLSVEAAMEATRAIKRLSASAQPQFFELITGASIRSYLLQDYPTVFSASDEAVLILAVEASSAAECDAFYAAVENTAREALKAAAPKCTPQDFYKLQTTSTLRIADGIGEFEVMRKPREELPKKLRTKCKTDMEIRTEYLGEVLKIVAATSPRALATQKRDVLFGHLTPRHTAIIHWNIGGFDLYDEEQADVAWSYLENVIGKAQSLAPADDPHGSARFTGEHGLAGKAPFLWLNYIPKEDFERMCAVKDTLDPHDLFNPDTIFLRTSYARSLRARLLSISHEKLSAFKKEAPAEESYAIEQGLKCTRCTSCKICPVIDAEHELRRENPRNAGSAVLPSKRNVLMAMERIALLRGRAREQGTDAEKSVTAITAQILRDSAELLRKCFYCRRCDKACPVEIEIHPLVRAYHAMGKMKSMGSRLWGFLYERLMGEDVFKSLTYKLLAFVLLLSRPVLALVRELRILPNWLKTYTVPPTLSLTHYEPLKEGVKQRPDDNFVVIAKPHEHALLPVANATVEATTVYVRYRGCMDTFGKPEATSSVDSYFKDVLNARIVDLEKKVCCGFPFEADGLHERARQLQFASLVEIARCIVRLRAEPGGADLKFVVFSNCPTCCEAIREMRDLLKDASLVARLRAKLGIDSSVAVESLQFDVRDTAEIALNLIKKMKAAGEALDIPTTQMNQSVGLKVPCHNTKAATEAQFALLRMYYKEVPSYDNCCGLSGTGRLKHPKIGTKISEKMFEQIEENPSQVIVTGCPSCRDGVKIQRDILRANGEDGMDFDIQGIFEKIVSDRAKCSVIPGSHS